MKNKMGFAIIPIACLAMGACKFGGGDDKKAPTGQVVATVNGEEITMRDLNLEMAGANIPDPKAMKAAQEQTLQKMIERKVLAQNAKTQGLDKSPDYALQQNRATEALLAQALQTKLKQTQDDLAEKTVEASAGGGMVQVVADGAMRIRSIRIDPAMLAANDKEMLQDLVVAGVNESLRRAQEMVTQEMSKLSPMSGMNIPGLFGGRS